MLRHYAKLGDRVVARRFVVACRGYDLVSQCMIGGV